MTDYAALFRELAVPRLVGTPNHARVRETLTRELTARGFTVETHAFVAAPTRLAAVALVGVVIAWGAIGTVLLLFLSPHSSAVRVGWVLTVIAVAMHVLLTARARSGAEATVQGVNLIARRPQRPPAAWLTAHYDSKGQPISMATRLIAVVLAISGVAGLVAHGAVALGVLVEPPPINAVLLTLPALVGGILLAQNRATDGSPGAVDNASALVTIFMILDRLPREADVGVVFPDAEELGLVGARALVEDRRVQFGEAGVVNFDGIDDAGRPIAFLHRAGPLGRALAAELGADRARWLPVLVDGIELAVAARECVTIMKGGWATTRIVHTPDDTPDRLTLAGAREVAEGVARVLARP